MKKSIIIFDILIVCFVFILGILISNLFSPNIDYPNSNTDLNEVNSPSDWLSNDNVLQYKDKIVLNLENTRIVSLAPTNSMDPVFDSESQVIEIIPESASEINVGDIISFTESDDKTYIHRIIIKDFDEDGYFFITKGDNNVAPDPNKIRFSQVKGVVAAILY